MIKAKFQYYAKARMRDAFRNGLTNYRKVSGKMILPNFIIYTVGIWYNFILNIVVNNQEKNPHCKQVFIFHM